MSEVSVRVAARIRPLLPKEVVHNHRVSVWALPESSKLTLGTNDEFSFDHVFGPTARQNDVYESCVQPLVMTLIDGYNATVFCYGQTGSGKTYTLRGGNLDEEGGIIDRVAQDLFLMLEEKRTNSNALKTTVQASYIELYMEEIRDLLSPSTPKELHIREDERGNTVVSGAKEQDVTSAEELLDVVETGNFGRHTATTGMNEHSSRSHAILTLQITQSCPDNKSALSSKLNLVDLAGLERADKTGNTGTQLKESVYINTGLLALGNVMRALADPRRNHAHVPYRDTKLTRLLRDSLGGTAHTLMVACVSPSSHSVPETMGILRFASKARCIRNRPGLTRTEVKSCPTTWNPINAQVSNLEYEVKTLRELLKEKEIEIERERTNRRAGKGNSFTLSSQGRIFNSNKKRKQEESTQYCFLALDAAALLTDICSSSPSHSFTQRVQDWQHRLAAVSHSHQDDNKECSDRGDGQSDHDDVIKLREELSKCKEALTIEEQLFEQKDTELRQVQKETERLLQENKAHVQALEEEKKRSRLQTEQLVDQQILIKHLRSDLMMFRDATSGAKVKTGASENLCRRPHSVPLIRQGCGHRTPRSNHFSPPAYSLERVMAAFKMQGHLLLAEIEEKDEVYCSFIKPLAESKKEEEEEEDEVEEEEGEDNLMGRVGFRRSLNRTWTSRQTKSALKEKHTGTDQTLQGILSRQATGTEAIQSTQSQTREARLRANATQRRIRDLSVNMRMKEELIKELNKTDKQAKVLIKQSEDGTEAGVLMRLSTQRQLIQSEVYHSLQHMRLQRAQLQSSLRELELIEEQREEDMTVCKSNQHEKLKKELHERNWLEEEEEQLIQKRAELQELEGELRRREEVLLHREACLQQKNRLEIKKLRSSQALSQDLLRVSMQLDSVEEQMKSRSSISKIRGVTRGELERERDILKRRKDILDAQLKDNRIFTVQEEHSLLELKEAIEALDAALEFKNRFIQDKQKRLSITDSSSETDQLLNVIRKLKKLSLPEVLELLMKYFNKVVRLREVEHQLRLRCEELQIQVGEQELVVREMEAAMHHQALDADRRFTQQHRDHQSSLQVLLQKLKEGGSGEPQQTIQERLQHLEKELFFYKSSSRQLKKKLKELNGDAQRSVDQSTHSHEHRKTHTDANQLQMHNEEAQARRHILTTYTKIKAEHTEQQTHNDPHMRRHSHQAPCSSSSTDLHVHKTTNIPEYQRIQIESQSQRGRGSGQSGEDLVMTPVRLCRRELREISPANHQATRKRQSVLGASSESMLEDSIEVSKNTDI